MTKTLPNYLLVSIYIFTSYTTINIKIHTIKCYKFNGVYFNINCCVWRKYIY